MSNEKLKTIIKQKVEEGDIILFPKNLNQKHWGNIKGYGVVEKIKRHPKTHGGRELRVKIGKKRHFMFESDVLKDLKVLDSDKVMEDLGF